MPAILITRAATSAVSRACAHALAPDHDLVLLDFPLSALQPLQQALQEANPKRLIHSIEGSLTDPSALRAKCASLPDLVAVVFADVETEEAAQLIPAFENALDVIVPVLQRAAFSTFIVIGSEQSAMPGHAGGVYGAAHAYIERRLLDKRLELKNAHIRFTYLALGSVEEGSLAAEDVAQACKHVLEAAPHCCISRLEVLPTARKSIGWVHGAA